MSAPTSRDSDTPSPLSITTLADALLHLCPPLLKQDHFGIPPNQGQLEARLSAVGSRVADMQDVIQSGKTFAAPGSVCSPGP